MTLLQVYLQPITPALMQQGCRLFELLIRDLVSMVIPLQIQAGLLAKLRTKLAFGVVEIGRPS
jgi:hypothetical protein